MDLEQTSLALEFAEHARTTGWNDATLYSFCAERGISSDDRQRRWPAGARSVGWQLNGLADERMLRLFQDSPAPFMANIFLSRFSQNRKLKPAVAKLALSDLRHPIDTLARTRWTARFMWRCYGRDRWASRLGKAVDGWLLVAAYSLCVIVWLLDRSADERITERTVRGSLLIIGLR